MLDVVEGYAELGGIELDPEQQQSIDVMTSVDEVGKWAMLVAAIIEPRQNGKTDGTLLPIVLAELFDEDNPDWMVWTAHLFKTCRKAFVAFKRAIDSSDELTRRVKKISEAHGGESIELMSGAQLDFLARSKVSGRGLGGKVVVLDEGFALGAGMLGALLPTLSARPNPLVLIGSSAGMADSEELRDVRDAGRKGGDDSLAYIEFCAPGSWRKPGCDSPRCDHHRDTPGCALDRMENLQAANPALGRRITLKFLRNERRKMPPEEYGREVLGWWDDPIENAAPILLEDWATCGIGEPDPRPTPAAFFLDCSPGLASASIGVAALHKRKPHLELADHRPGTDWLPARVKELKASYPQAKFAVLASGAVSALLPKLDEVAGVKPQQLNSQDMGRACAHLQRLVASRGLTHTKDPLLAAALAVAVKRDMGDDLWTWSRRKSGDISPLVALTGAGWLLEILINPPAEIF